jgi:DNA-binding response OmpR family regulator
MPMISGIDALRQIRSSESCFNTPVMMLTARRSVADEEIAIRAGANDYMRKPFDMANLVARTDSLLLNAQWRPKTSNMHKSLPAAPGRAALKQNRDRPRLDS